MQIFLDPDGGSFRAVSSSGDYLVTEKRTGASEGIFKIWHITDPKPRKVIPHKFLGDQGLLFSPRQDVLTATCEAFRSTMNPTREEPLFALALEKPAHNRPAPLDATCEG